MSVKIAYCAGHYMKTPGKRCLKSIDPNETREWVLNDRVADHFAKAAKMYEGVELLRTDDATGKKFIDIPERCAMANKWGADIYIDMHHNAGIKGGKGGGVEAFCYPKSTKGKSYRDAIYKAVIEAGGLKGNRSQPLKEKAFESLSSAHAPAVLIEYGFMDSKTDTPVILTESYSKAVAYATMEGIAKVAGLKKKQAQPEPKPTETKPTKTEEGKYTMEMRVIKEGHKGEDVKALQILLNGRGYNCGSVDGIFGSKTLSAVKKYQKAKKLSVDGMVGPATMGSLMGA